MKNEGMEISGANTFTSELGKLVTDDVHLFEVNEKFEVLDFGPVLIELPEEIVKDLSTDQKYMYKMSR